MTLKLSSKWWPSKRRVPPIFRETFARARIGSPGLLSGGPQATDEFFRSVRGAFQRNEDNAGAMGVTLLLLVAAVLLVALVRPPLRRQAARRKRRDAFSRLVTDRALSREDRELLAVLADHAGTEPFLVATHIDVFERATAAELRGLTPTLTPHAPHARDAYARLRRLRERLDFASHLERDALLTTRELRPGYSVEVFGAKTVVAAVTEAYFSVLLPDAPDAAVGAKVPLTVLQEREASYSVASPLLGLERGRSGWTLFFAHDEAPARQQKRQFVRVPGSGPVELVHEIGQTPSRHEQRFQGTLLDVSLHGAAITTREKVAVRARVRVSFSFRGETFERLDAFVLECEGRPSGPYRLRLEFRGLSHGDDRRLSTAIAHATTRKSAAPSSASV